MRVLRVYHAGRDAAHRERDRAVVRAGVELTLVVPAVWPGPDELGDEPFDVMQLAVRRPGDVNRHRYADPGAIAELVARRRPDVVDLHEEPFSSVVHQLLGVLPAEQRVVAYTAQNIDKRFPPPFAQWERAALGRIGGLYPCTRQAASVAVGKGFRGAVRVLPLAPAPEMAPGAQQAPADEVAMLLVGRLVPEKGVLDAVRVLAAVRRQVGATLDIVGAGPEAERARRLARELGVADAVTIRPWTDAGALADHYRAAQVVLAPSRATRTWVEQFGRMVVEAQASGAVVAGYASGALPEVVGGAGVLVPEGDVHALARAVLDLRDDPDGWRRLRDAGLAAARERTWEAVAAGQLALYDDVRTARPRERVRPQRRHARREWGEPAPVAGGARPFALPVLRNDTAGTRALAKAVDALMPRDDAHGAPLRVVYVDHVARMSGGEVALLRLIQALPDVDAHVILGEDGPLRAALESAGARVEVLALDPAARDLRRAHVAGGRGSLRAAALTAAYTLRLARRMRQLRPDLVHTNSLKAGYYGSVAARLAGVPVVWHLRDRIADDYLPRRAVRLTRAALRVLPDVVVCNSAETLRLMDGDVRSGAVIASPVVHDPYAASELARRGLVDGGCVGIVGRLAEWKGQHVFLRALAELRAAHPHVHGRVVGAAMFGEEAYERQLHALVADLDLADAVTFTGFVDDVEGELAALDVLVHASVVPEPFGQVVVEGMAAGLPVVATAAGGPEEIITDGVDGLLVPPGDVAALAAVLSRLFDDAGLRERLGRAAADRALDFAPSVIAEQMRALYDRVLRAHL